MIKSFLMAGLLLALVGCCAAGNESQDDSSRIGGIIGVIIGFGLFFMAIFLSARAARS